MSIATEATRRLRRALSQSPAGRRSCAARGDAESAVRPGIVVGLAVFAVMVFPVFWMVSTALKPDDEINEPHADVVLDRARRSITSATRSTGPYFWDAVKNSLIIVGVTVVLSIVLAFLAAVALAKYRFTGRSLFVVLMIGILMLPQVGSRHPALRRARQVPPDERRPDRGRWPA